MAEYNSFTYDEIKSSDFGVYIGGEKTFDAPSLRGQSIEIPGRNGNVFISSDSYENVELVYPSFNFEPDLETFRSKLAKLRNALSSRASYKRLTDTLHPDEFRMAVFRDGFEVKPIKYNTAAEFDIVFDCKPQRFLKSGEIPVEYTPGQTPSDEQTKTGSIVTFEAEEGTIISDVKADINPVQDLHGYDKPWAGGNGKNLLQVTSPNKTISGVTYTIDSDGTVNANGTATNIAWIDLGTVDVVSGKQYVISGGYSSSTYLVIKGHSSWSSRGDETVFTADSSSITVQAVVSNGTTANNVKLYPMIRLASETDPTWEPYSNICPISGWDSVKVTRTGKNLLNCTLETITRAGITFTVNTDGTVVATGTATGIAHVDYGTVDLKGGVEYKLNGGVAARQYVVVKGYAAWQTGTADKAFTPPSDMTATIQIVVREGEHANGEIFKPMIRLASETDASYEPYNGNTYTTALGRTVYGGTLDVTSGVLKVCPYYASYNGETLTGEWVSDRDEYSPNTSPTIGAQVVNIGGPLTTVQLTPTEVKTLLGTNNIWADSGDITVKYGTNPYIIVNPTNFPSKPLLEVTGVGSFWLGDTQITITGTSGQTVYIGCETGECYKVTGGIISPANGLVTLNRLDFPKLASGINNIQLGAGISKVKITPRWWRL